MGRSQPAGHSGNWNILYASTEWRDLPFTVEERMAQQISRSKHGAWRAWLGWSYLAPWQSNVPLPVFCSDRERRLWVWTAAVVAALYSTLGLARTLAGALRDNGLLEVSFVFGALLVGATILTQAMKTRPGGAEIGIALGVAAAYLMVLVRIASPEERTHLIEYGVVAILIHEALTERALRGRRVPLPALLAALATAVLGVLDECIQALLPSRVFDVRDILFNVLAGVMAVAASVALGWAWRRRR